MEAGSIGVGFMAVFAISGSVVFIAREAHKRLLSDFMKKIEFELGGTGKCKVKKRVRFADDVMEPSSNNKEYRKRNPGFSLAKQAKVGDHDHDRQQVLKISDSMPLNRQVLYKGILKYKTLKTPRI
ncbi:uncharacterized protein LOC111296996 [Durio zibethinus]|uniref:Uncharacterized protein LOC111296996 n=1 Tax=Durio zibethinus TaxID=66656 RepID=A0A6P5Z3U2_DURZI|nr:uncharacterized protein LOC111296996 [Durio zibethinus]